MRDDTPPLALAAQERARELAFEFSCSADTGRLLRTLAALRPDGRVAESGSGTGYGAAWLLDGLGESGRLVTVEHDAERARTTAQLFEADARVSALHGDWRLLDAHGPFDFFFCDGGGKTDDPDHVVELLAPGGVLVLDDFTPSDQWPPLYEGRPDALRLRYLEHPRLRASEVRVSSQEAVIIGVRLPG